MLLNTEYMVKTFFLCVKAIPVTLKITVISILLAFTPALIIALGRTNKIKAIEAIGKFYVSIIRGTPIVLQILIIYSLVPSLLNVVFKSIGSNINIFDLNPVIYAYIVFSLNSIATRIADSFKRSVRSRNYNRTFAFSSLLENNFPTGGSFCNPKLVYLYSYAD